MKKGPKRSTLEKIWLLGGKPTTGQWSGEASVLALGVSEEEARELGSIYQQNAVVWCGEDATPRLLLLR